MVGLRLWEVQEGRYRNSAVARRALVPGQPGYVGDEHPALFRAWLPAFGQVSELVRQGKPAHPLESRETQEFWSLLTPMLARKGQVVAERALDLLRLMQPAPRLLDLGGGGAAMYAQALLRRHPQAVATQVDWPHINAMARQAMVQAGLADRFRTVDGDFTETELGEASYDVVVLSHIAHLKSPQACAALFRRAARALVAGGRVVVVDWVVDDGRTGPPSALLFNLSMMLLTPEGRSYERQEFAALLTECGFDQPRFEKSEDWATIILATIA
jgi:SAM-dependent methyltransferase